MFPYPPSPSNADLARTRACPLLLQPLHRHNQISYGGLATGSSCDLTVQTTSLRRPKHIHSSVVDGSGLFFFPDSGGGSAATLIKVLEAKKASHEQKEFAELQVSPHAGFKNKVSNNLQRLLLMVRSRSCGYLKLLRSPRMHKDEGVDRADISCLASIVNCLPKLRELKFNPPEFCSSV
ncbi:hypothetical protein EJB05_13813, partial [Eragrostis curvula]